MKIELLKMVQFFPMTEALGKEEKLMLRFVNTFLGFARDSGVVSVGFLNIHVISQQNAWDFLLRIRL